MKKGGRTDILRISLTLLRPSEQNNLTNQWVSDAELNLNLNLKSLFTFYCFSNPSKHKWIKSSDDQRINQYWQNDESQNQTKTEMCKLCLFTKIRVQGSAKKTKKQKKETRFRNWKTKSSSVFQNGPHLESRSQLASNHKVTSRQCVLANHSTAVLAYHHNTARLVDHSQALFTRD